MSAANTDKILKVGKPGTATTLSSPGHTSGGTSITVGSTTNWPTDTGVAFAIDRAELVAGEEVQIPGTYTEWIGVVSGATTITDMVISGDSPNSDQNYASGSLTRVYIPVSATRENKLVEWGLTHADQDGTLKAGAVDNVAVIADDIITPAKFTDELKGGWAVGEIAAPTAVTANGNRSYTLTYASSVASTVSAGMRRRFTRTVAANTYMGGAFNGSSHYFTKTTPSGTLGTVTNNFTIEITYMPTSYAIGYICGRMDATPNNGFGVVMEADGRVRFQIFNGGVGNGRAVTTYQSLPLGKKTTIGVTMTGATILIYLDGIAVPTVTSTTGTAPTTAATGGDWSIGRSGLYTGAYANGYISNVAVFDAVLSAATIRQHATYKLTGSETNCIGAWSLDNTANDQSSAGNNLTATGGVGYTNISPFGNNGVSSTLEYALTMSVSSDGLTEVVQVPEGCALPTTGGITASAYSTNANPYGYPQDDGWRIFAPTFTNLAVSRVTGSYKLVGKTCTYTGLVVASGGGSGTFSCTIPVATAGNGAAWVGSCWALDSGTAYYVGTCSLVSSGTAIDFTTSGNVNQWGTAIPHTWAASDSIRFTITYETA
jgi:hypothetical protein